MIYVPKWCSENFLLITFHYYLEFLLPATLNIWSLFIKTEKCFFQYSAKISKFGTFHSIFMLIKSLVSYQKLGGLEERIAGSHPFDPGSNPRRSQNFFLFFYKINQKNFFWHHARYHSHLLPKFLNYIQFIFSY